MIRYELVDFSGLTPFVLLFLSNILTPTLLAYGGVEILLLMGGLIQSLPEGFPFYLSRIIYYFVMNNCGKKHAKTHFYYWYSPYLPHLRKN